MPRAVRHVYALLTGLVLTYYPFGAGIIHAFPPAIITYMAMLAVPRSCGSIAWVANFAYLIYLWVDYLLKSYCHRPYSITNHGLACHACVFIPACSRA